MPRSQGKEVEKLTQAVESLRQENLALKGRLDTHEQERLAMEEYSQRNKEQLQDMSQMVSYLGRMTCLQGQRRGILCLPPPEISTDILILDYDFVDL